MLDLHGAPARPRAVEVPLGGRIAGAAGEIFLVAGLALLLYVGWQLWDATVYTEEQPEEVRQKLLDGFHESPAPDRPPGEELAQQETPDGAVLDESTDLVSRTDPGAVDLARLLPVPAGSGADGPARVH